MEFPCLYVQPSALGHIAQRFMFLGSEGWDERSSKHTGRMTSYLHTLSIVLGLNVGLGPPLGLGFKKWAGHQSIVLGVNVGLGPPLGLEWAGHQSIVLGVNVGLGPPLSLGFKKWAALYWE